MQRYSDGAVLDASNEVVERTVSLAGGTLLTKRAGGDAWSYPNIHGDVQAAADGAGVKQGATVVFGPFGEPLVGEVDNAAGSFDFGWVGQHEKHSEHEFAGSSVIEMGARVYVPELGRFLQIDPVYGGTPYAYICVDDSINDFVLTGEWGLPRIRLPNPAAAAKKAAKQVVSSVGRVTGRATRLTGRTISSGSRSVWTHREAVGDALGLASTATAIACFGGAFCGISLVTGAASVVLNATARDAFDAVCGAISAVVGFGRDPSTRRLGFAARVAGICTAASGMR